MKSLDWYKDKFGGGDFAILPDGKIFIPVWAAKFFLAQSGLKTKKRRVIKKVIKREVEQAIKRGLNR